MAEIFNWHSKFYGEDGGSLHTDGISRLDFQVQRFLVRRAFSEGKNKNLSVADEVLKQNKLVTSLNLLTISPHVAARLLFALGYDNTLVFRNHDMMLEKGMDYGRTK